MPEYEIKTLGSAVKGARKKRRLSQQGLADLTGISKRHIAKIENGISNPSFEIIAILANHLFLSIDQVLYSNDFSEENTFIRDITIRLLKCSPSQQQVILNIIEIMVTEFNSNRESE